jgi:hypothetical protein
MKRYTLIIILLGLVMQVQAQIRPMKNDSSIIDTTVVTNKDAIYNRPFVLKKTLGKSRFTAALGGYAEGNTNYFATDGVSDGFSMEFRRFNIFIYSSVLSRIRFISELEFEHGVEEINLETALIDIEIHPALILRGGILLPPIGLFNQNHDGPKWEFIDRPLVSTRIVPSTLSEIGFGLHGKIPISDFAFTYEAYMVNGLQDDIILNEDNRTSIPHGKNPDFIGQDNNGTPSITGRLGFKHRKIGEVGLSYYGGIYNTFKKEGLQIDDARWTSLAAFDYNLSIANRLQVIGEVVYAHVDVPTSVGQQSGTDQIGFHIDLIGTLYKTKLWFWKNASINLSMRVEYLDYNIGEFNGMGLKIYDEAVALVFGLSFRFSPGTLLRLNYRYQWDWDILGNPPAQTGGIQFGFATYF